MIAAISHRFAINSHAYAMCVVKETKQLLVAAVADYNDKVIRRKGSKRDTNTMQYGPTKEKEQKKVSKALRIVACVSL